jgi:C1A family cysteine protease
VAATGPLSIALDATLAFQFYKRGVLDPNGLIGGCGKNPQLNHAVLLVGYGSDGGKAYWTIKNSWGQKWGEGGYFRFARGEARCGVNAEATTAILA